MKTHAFIVSGLAIASLSAFTGVVVALEARQELPAAAGDLSSARLVEVRDASGQVLFSGQFGEAVERDGERERKAVLIGSGGSTCEAEIELSTVADGSTRQELEVDVKGVAAGSTLSVSVDGTPIASFTADAKGEAEVELSGAAGR